MGLTIAEVARRAGAGLTDLDDVYTGGPHVHPSEVVDLDDHCLWTAEEASATGDEVLRRSARAPSRSCGPSTSASPSPSTAS